MPKTQYLDNRARLVNQITYLYGESSDIAASISCKDKQSGDTITANPSEIRQALAAILCDERNEHLCLTDTDRTLNYRFDLSAIYTDPGARRDTKIAKHFNKLWKDIIPVEAHRSQLSDIIAAKLFPTATFTIHKGQELLDLYGSWEGSDLHSCMTYKRKIDADNLLDFYLVNDDIISLVYYECGKYKARALLWKIDGTTYVDRIYPTSGPHIAKLHNWASENNYHIRYNKETHREARNHCVRIYQEMGLIRLQYRRNGIYLGYL